MLEVFEQINLHHSSFLLSLLQGAQKYLLRYILLSTFQLVFDKKSGTYIMNKVTNDQSI